MTNSAGTATSFLAELIADSNPAPDALTLLWHLPCGSRTYLTGSNNQRGLTYNPVTGNLILVNRSGGISVHVIDAATGTNRGTLSTEGIAGGTFALSKIEVSDDGVIYGANFGTYPGTTFTIYRWADENAMPTIAFAGDPANGAGNQQYGNSLALRGGGTNTQILVPTQRDVVALLTTPDGTNFVSTLIAGLPTGGFYHGVAFGAGDTFWGKTNNQPLYHASFDLGSGTGAILDGWQSAELPTTVTPIAVDAQNRLLAGLSVATPDTVSLYDIADPELGQVLMQSLAFPTDIANTLFAGALDFGAGKLFVLDSNNGLAAYNIPHLQVGLPELAIRRDGNNVVISWPGSSTGFALQWTPSLLPANWTTFTPSPVLTDNQWTVTITNPTDTRFFRLLR